MTSPSDSFYAPPSQINNEIINLEEKEAHHIIKVLRKKPGNVIRIIDGLGNAYECEILSSENQTFKAQILHRLEENNEPYTELTLAVAIPKKDKFEFIIEKCTELGVKKIIPLISERTQVKTKSFNRLRCDKIAVSAMKQSLRSFLPEIEEPLPLKELLQRNDFALKIVAHEKIENTSLLETLTTVKSSRSILLVIGPEGGFSDEEISSFKGKGYNPVSLGKRRLRTETASIIASAIILDNLETRKQSI